MESITKTKISRQRLAQIVDVHLGKQLISAEELKDGWFNTTYALQMADGSRAVLKAAPPPDLPVLRYEKGILRSELRAMDLVRQRTQVPIPTVFVEDFTRHWMNLDFYIMDWLPGSVLNAIQDHLPADELNSVRVEIGVILSAINSIGGASFGMFAAPIYSTWREGFGGYLPGRRSIPCRARLRCHSSDGRTPCRRA